MNITVNQITPRRENGEVIHVSVHFTAQTSDGSIRLNGSVPIVEFDGLINFAGIEDTVRQEVSNRIMNGEPIDAE